MTPLLWFLAGACFGALCGVVLMAVAIMKKEESDDWEAALRTWSRINASYAAELGVFDASDATWSSASSLMPYDHQARCRRCGCLSENHDEGGCRVCSCSLPAHAIG